MTTIHNHLLPLKMWTVEDSNVMMKIKLKREKANPTSTSIRQNLGPRLADAVFSNVCPFIKTVIGIDKELDGPGDDLASKPHRQLLGELILEPFPSRRRRQALTHQAIIDYGEKCMEKWENQVAGQQGSEMNAKLKEMHEKMAELMESKINQIKKKEREDFLVRIAMMEERLEERHKKEMEALTRKLTDEKNSEIAETMATMNASHQHETDNLLETTKKLLMSQYQFKINWIKSDLEEDYNNKLSEKTKLIGAKLRKEFESNYNDGILANKNQMLQNVVCTACLTTDFLLKEFKDRVELLKKEMMELCENNKTLQEYIEKLEEKLIICEMQKKSWECVMEDIFNQFQRFIAFQLKLPLEECNHMISWEKVLQKQNDLFQKLLAKYNVNKLSVPSQLSEKKIPEKAISTQNEAKSESFSNLCDNNVIISIISSIIRRVIPSDTKLTESEENINSILESILRKVIPSSSTIIEEVIESNKSDIHKILCPKFLRTGETSRERFSEEEIHTESELSKNIISKTHQDNLGNRIAEITKVMSLYPNILKFIQGP